MKNLLTKPFENGYKYRIQCLIGLPLLHEDLIVLGKNTSASQRDIEGSR
jgi:hypothetical protein